MSKERGPDFDELVGTDLGPADRDRLHVSKRRTVATVHSRGEHNFILKF